MKKQGRNKGFTLVEMLIVVAMIGILLAVATPWILNALPGYRLRAEVRELIISFKKVKLEAVKRNRNVVFRFAPGVGDQGGSYTIFVDMDADNVFAQPPDVWLSRREMPQSVLLLGANFAGTDNTGFSPRAVPLRTGNCEFRTSDDSRRFRLTLSVAGATRVESSSDGGLTWSAY